VEVNCAPIATLDHDSPRGNYDLQAGLYKSSVKATPFCEAYKLNQIRHFSCDNNVQSFVMSCYEKDATWTATFTCDHYGNCSTNDTDARTVKLTAQSHQTAEYSKKHGETIARTSLTYSGPCE
jgi:hypothetical protein